MFSYGNDFAEALKVTVYLAMIGAVTCFVAAIFFLAFIAYHVGSALMQYWGF